MLLIPGALNHGRLGFFILVLVLGLEWCLVWNVVGVVSLTKSEQRGEGRWPEGDLLTEKQACFPATSFLVLCALKEVGSRHHHFSTTGN